MPEVTKIYKEVEYVPLDKIVMHPDVPNVRQKINKGDCADLMKSVREHGIQNPITCFRDNGSYCLVSGERRLSSVRWLNEEDPKDDRFKTIPVLVKDYGKDRDMLVRNALYDNMIENIQREDLNGYDLAVRINSLLDRGFSKEEICKNIGKSVTWVNETLKFLESDDAVQDAVRKGDLTLDEGKKIAKLDPTKQGVVAKGLVAAKNSTDKAAKRTIKRKLQAATSGSGTVAPTKKEIKYTHNALAAIMKAITDAKDNTTADQLKIWNSLSGCLFTLEWTLGKRKDFALAKFLTKYGLELGKDGHKAKPKPEEEAGKTAKKEKK